MKFTKRTYLLMGMVSCACSFIAGALLILNITMGLLINISSIGLAAMMLFIIPRTDVKIQKITGFIASVFIILDMASISASPLFTNVSAVCGAAAFSIFACGYICTKNKAKDESVNTMAYLVFLVCGVQIFALFYGVSYMMGAVLIMTISAVQGVFLYTLLKEYS